MQRLPSSTRQWEFLALPIHRHIAVLAEAVPLVARRRASIGLAVHDPARAARVCERVTLPFPGAASLLAKALAADALRASPGGLAGQHGAAAAGIREALASFRKAYARLDAVA